MTTKQERLAAKIARLELKLAKVQDKIRPVGAKAIRAARKPSACTVYTGAEAVSLFGSI